MIRFHLYQLGVARHLLADDVEHTGATLLRDDGGGVLRDVRNEDALQFQRKPGGHGHGGLLGGGGRGGVGNAEKIACDDPVDVHRPRRGACAALLPCR